MNRKSHLVIAAIAALSATVYFINPYARILVHFLVGQVSHGVSAGKIMFFLGYLIAFSLRAAAIRQPPTDRMRWFGLFWLFIGPGMIASFSSHLLYVCHYDLPLDWYSFHWREGVNSVNSTTHIHTSKAIIAHVLNAVGLDDTRHSFDTGSAFLQAVPAWLSYPIGVAFLVSLGLGLWNGPLLIARYGPRAQVPLCLLAAIAFTSVSKCILDGGPLSYDALAGGLCVIALTRASSLGDLGRWLRCYAIRLICVASAWLLVIALLDLSTLVHQATCLAYRVAVYAFLLGWAWYRQCAQRARWQPVLIWGVGAATAGAFLIRDAGRSILPLFTPAPSTAHCYHVDPPVEGGALSMTKAGLTHTAVAIPPNTSNLAAYLMLGEMPLRVRNVSLEGGRQQRPTGIYADLIVLAVQDERLSFRPNPIVKIKRMEEDCRADQRRLHIQVEFSAEGGPVLWRGDYADHDQIAENEKFVAYRLLDAYLRSAGLIEYVLIPYAQYIDPAEGVLASGVREAIEENGR